MTHYIVEVRDDKYQRIGQVDSYISLDMVIRHCQAGTWQILIQEGTWAAQTIQKGYGVVIWKDGIERPILSGPVQEIQRYWTNDQHTGPGSVYFSGKTDDFWAYSFVGFPHYTQALAPPVSSVDGWKEAVCPQDGDQYVWSQKPAGDALWGFSRANFGPYALPDRQVPHLWFPPANPTVGALMDASVRYDVLGTLFETWTQQGNVGYRIIYSPDHERLEFEVSPLNDFTVHSDTDKTVIFSPELGNLKQVNWSSTAPTCTRAIVAAQGEGKERYVMQKVNTTAEAEWKTIAEQFIDRRDLPVKRGANGAPEIVKNEDGSLPEGYETEAAVLQALETEADKALEEGAGKTQLSIEPIDTPQCQFGRDYWVGDKVTVYSAFGDELNDIVREVHITHDSGGETIAPTIGTQQDTAQVSVFSQVKKLRQQVQRLNTRY